MLKITELIKPLFDLIKNIASFIKEFISDPNGIRTLYIMILTIPSICLLVLYHHQKVKTEELKIVVIELQKESKYNYHLYMTAKDSIRATIFDEYITLAKSMNELRESLSDSNDRNSKAIIKKSQKVEEEIKNIE